MPMLDFIVVGQGLAGTVLADTLIQNNKSIVVIDDTSYSTCSRVSAGLFNPMVFKRLNKSWMIDDLWKFTENYFLFLEKRFNETVYYKREILKLFFEENEKKFWHEKVGNGLMLDYMSGVVGQDYFTNELVNPFGAGIVKNAGNVDVRKVLLLLRDFFISSKVLIQERFLFSELILKEGYVKYKELEAKKIIFCEGFRAKNNPFFDWLPFKLSKGEILTIEMVFPWPLQVVNKGVFVLPLSDHIYKVGATHNWLNMDESPTSEGREELCLKLSRIMKVPYTILKHEAGIRPTTSDRRPLIGIHPEYETVGIFNGMGTKGVLLAPYFASHFIDFLDGKTTLNKEVDINRSWKGN